jgi:hypothetical protein
MVEKFNEKANALAGEYWRLKGIIANKKSENRLEEIENLLERGIGGKLRDKLEEEVKRLIKEREDKRNASMRVEEIKKEIMEVTAELAPNLDLMEGGVFPYDSEHEPISEDFFTALTEFFFGIPHSTIQFKWATFSKQGIEIHRHPDSDSEDSSLKILNHVIIMIQEAAKKKMGMENKIDNSWRRLKQNEYAFIVLSILIEEAKALKIEEIKEISHRSDKEYKELVRETYDKNLVKGLQYLMSGEWEYGMVKGKNGEYEVTDFGKWTWEICNADAKMCIGEKGKGGAKLNAESHFHKILKYIRQGK